MRSFLSVSVCLHGTTAAPSAEEDLSLMQRRLMKQLGTHKETPAPAVAYSEPPAYPEAYKCGEWGEWGECSASCGGGYKIREYKYTNGEKCRETCEHGNGDREQKPCNTDKHCPVDCVGNWNDMSPCSRTCDGGQQQRMYTISIEAQHGGKACPMTNGYEEATNCSIEACEVDCQGHWCDWSECSNGKTGVSNGEPADCDPLGHPPSGTQSRTYIVDTSHTDRGCQCEAEMWGSKEKVVVDADTTDTRSCGLPCCITPCEGSWSDWTQCKGDNLKWLVPDEVCCGGGKRSRTFTVTRPAECLGDECEAKHNEVEPEDCCMEHCPEPCEGEWGPFEPCQSNRTNSTKVRIYKKTKEALYGGAECPHKCGEVDEQPCNECDNPQFHPPPDGPYEPWSDCRKQKCEGEWGEWGECSATCLHPGQTAIRTRKFMVTKVAMFGGVQCEFDDAEMDTENCTLPPCPVPATCGWGPYGECGSCCKDCSNGINNSQPIWKHRKWMEITPAMHGGKECKNDPVCGAYEDCTKTLCDKPCCKIPCVGSWSKWGTCDAKKADPGDFFCGKGTKIQTYKITQEARFDGAACPHEDGHQNQTTCGEAPCPRPCLGEFEEWSQCTKTCGGGQQQRKFIVHQTALHGGHKCPYCDKHVEYRNCSTDCCVIDCEGEWSDFSDCSLTCKDCLNNGAAGKKTRAFTVTKQEECGGEKCIWKKADEDNLKKDQILKNGEIHEAKCSDHCCPQNCEGSFSNWTACSTSCGQGNRQRTYTVTRPAAYGGLESTCECHNGTEVGPCPGREAPCPVDCIGEFTQWGQCSEKCGGGQKHRWFVHHQQAQHDGKECAMPQYHKETKDCNTQECAKMCLGAFTTWSACTKPGSSKKEFCTEDGDVPNEKKRTFMVFRPASGGGVECTNAHGDIDTAPCNTHKCPEFECPPELEKAGKCKSKK